jgi:hypothetical protein
MVVQLPVVSALFEFMSAPLHPHSHATVVAAKLLHAKSLGEKVCRIGLHSTSLGHSMITAMVCDSIASFLRGVADGWGMHQAHRHGTGNVRRSSFFLSFTSPEVNVREKALCDKTLREYSKN